MENMDTTTMNTDDTVIVTPVSYTHLHLFSCLTDKSAEKWD